MMSLIQQIRNGQLWDFHGGIHPDENKCQSNQSPIRPVVIPNQLILPIKQHIGNAGKLLVTLGENVLKGQVLTESDHFQTCPIHAPTSGKITAIEPRQITHPSGLMDTCIVIVPDHKDTWGEKKSLADFKTAPPELLIEHIRLMGIAGMGGAGFPTARKIQSSFKHTELLIINGAECEPYITADDRLMQENALEIATGIEILQHISSPKLTLIAIEDNKPEAIEAISKAIDGFPNTLVRVIPTKYPSGSEKQLIKILTGKEVPSKTIPASIGMMVQNVGTLFAIKRAVIDGEPLIERVVTLTGEQIKDPGNHWVLLGTPVSFLLNKHLARQDKRLERLILGGPMMGFSLPGQECPIIKTANCVLVPSQKEMPLQQAEMACIRCSACADACPVSLLPQQLQWYAKAQDFEKCHEYNLTDCIECGACAYVCPSDIPLVSYYRQAKAEIREREADALSAQHAKARFEAKKNRLERDKRAREEKHQQAAMLRRQAMEKNDDKDQIAAAIARIKAKQAKENAATEHKPAVAAAIARVKEKQAQALTEPDNSEVIKLREARKQAAREKRAQTQTNDKTQVANENAAHQTQNAAQTHASSRDQDTNKQAVAAAIARAKARKEALSAKVTETKTAQETIVTPDKSEQATPDKAPISDEKSDEKKAAIAAAIARVKARKKALSAKEHENTSKHQKVLHQGPITPQDKED